MKVRILSVTFLCLTAFLAVGQTVSAPQPYGVIPSGRQLAWHETEFYAIIHFTPTTFENKEWGYGDADPDIFNPSSFNAEQIVDAVKSAGMKGIVFVCKHHDGFCLWPTATTEYNISKSPWRNGKGDMVREMRDACDKLGLKFGVYVSPWDRNHPGYGTSAYVDAYREQLRELYTGYGDIFMSWHDGANGGDGYYGGARETRTIDRSTYYGWDSLWAMTRELQPDACIFSDIGWDVRWVGNEQGLAGETCWYTYTPKGRDDGSAFAPGETRYREATEGHRDGKYWMPAECDVPLRNGWFYHPQEDNSAKSPEMLFDIYCQSVGRGQGLDLGLCPDRRGLLHENDVAVLRDFGHLLDNVFSENLAALGTVVSSGIRGGDTVNFGTGNLFDDDRYSYWTTDDTAQSAMLEIAWDEPVTFDLVTIRENLRLGQRIEKIAIDIWTDGVWNEAASATSIGNLRIIRFPGPVTAERARLRIVETAATPCISEFGIFLIPPKQIWLHDLDISKMEAGWGTTRAKLTVDSNQLTVAGKVYENGVGTHAISKIMIDFCQGPGNSMGSKSCISKGARFSALVGVDDEANNEQASVEFFVMGDQRILWRSGVMKYGDVPQKVDVSLDGVRKLALFVSDAGDFNYYDHADWLESFIEYRKEPPVAIDQPVPQSYILTPPAGDNPRINGPSVYGATPGKPFLFRIPVTGKRPMNFTAHNLPESLEIDVSEGIIKGTAPDSGTYTVNITVRNAIGEAYRELKIITGQGLALTPPMGWNSWNCWGLSVDDQKVRAAADAFISSGLADHGWSFINIDDGWEAAERTTKGELLANDKFPDMKALSAYVHSQGLKLGIYSSPGPLTCGGFQGSYEYEKYDVMTWSDWGIDYLKYDWCSYGKIALNDSLPELQKPYILMDKLLEEAPRDIVFSLCQYGMGNVWEWGRQTGGNLWRTTGDITDTWESMAGIGFSQDKCSSYASPGGWNDPDMLVVGQVGWGPNLHTSKLTADEQYTHISLWCLLSAPLLIGCDLSDLDKFTLSLLTNDEVLAVDQDEPGKQATCVKREKGYEIWAKPMADSSFVIGMFNTGLQSPIDAFNWEAGGMPGKTITVSWADIGIAGVYTVRDLWRQQDIGQFGSVYTAEVPFHGVVLVRLSR